MTSMTKLMLAGVIALVATPALAFTSGAPVETPNGWRFADPDAALDNLSSAGRDQALLGGLGAAAAFDGSGATDGSGRGDGAFSGRIVDTRALGHEPTLSAADLYDHEPPFMPVVVGDPR